jgi:hypothetical protein
MALVDTVLKPARVLPPPPDMQWNYLVNLYTRWYAGVAVLVIVKGVQFSFDTAGESRNCERMR